MCYKVVSQLIIEWMIKKDSVGHASASIELIFCIRGKNIEVIE